MVCIVEFAYVDNIRISVYERTTITAVPYLEFGHSYKNLRLKMFFFFLLVFTFGVLRSFESWVLD